MKNTFRLLAILLAFSLCVFLFFFINGTKLGSLFEETPKRQLQPNVLDPEAIGPNDSFYRVLNSGIPNAQDRSETIYSDLFEGSLYEVVKEYVKKDDVVAQSETQIRKGSWRFNMFASDKLTGQYWIEDTDWCIRLKFKPGQEEQFAYSLMRLAGLGHSDLLGLPKLRRGDNFTHKSAMASIKPQDKNGMLIPIHTNLEGKSAAKITNVQWYISPDSKICDNITKK
jgi:hypothetical protein